MSVAVVFSSLYGLRDRGETREDVASVRQVLVGPHKSSQYRPLRDSRQSDRKTTGALGRSFSKQTLWNVAFTCVYLAFPWFMRRYQPQSRDPY